MSRILKDYRETGSAEQPDRALGLRRRHDVPDEGRGRRRRLPPARRRLRVPRPCRAPGHRASLRAGAPAARRVVPRLSVRDQAAGAAVSRPHRTRTRSSHEALRAGRAHYLPPSATRSSSSSSTSSCSTRAPCTRPSLARIASATSWRRRPPRSASSCRSGAVDDASWPTRLDRARRAPPPEGGGVRDPARRHRRPDAARRRPRPSAFLRQLVNYTPHKADDVAPEVRHASRLLSSPTPRSSAIATTCASTTVDVKVLTMKEPPAKTFAHMLQDLLHRPEHVHRVPGMAAPAERADAARPARRAAGTSSTRRSRSSTTSARRRSPRRCWSTTPRRRPSTSWGRA